MNNKYQDLLIIDRDVSLDENDNPHFIDGRESIAQDIKHMLMELNLFVELIGNRDPEKERQVFNRVTLLVDADLRIVAGTSRVIKNDEQFWVLATTIDYGDIRVEL
jgi:hypothetical protein